MAGRMQRGFCHGLLTLSLQPVVCVPKGPKPPYLDLTGAEAGR